MQSLSTLARPAPPYFHAANLATTPQTPPAPAPAAQEDEAVRQIRAARQRLDAAERRVRALRATVAATAPDSEALPPFRAELCRLERSVFSRRLELDELLKQRRRMLPSLTTLASGS
jgi:hypothetical protein